MKPLSKKHRNDLFLIFGFLLIAGICMVVLFLTRQDGGYVSVIQNGTEIAQYALDEAQSIVVTDQNGGSNTLTVSDGCVKMTAADCPDKLCVHQRAIRYNGETIVCLPHKLVLKVVSEQEPDIDIAT